MTNPPSIETLKQIVLNKTKTTRSAGDGLTLEQIESSTGGVDTTLLEDDKIYLETVNGTEIEPRVTTIGEISNYTISTINRNLEGIEVVTETLPTDLLYLRRDNSGTMETKSIEISTLSESMSVDSEQIIADTIITINTNLDNAETVTEALPTDLLYLRRDNAGTMETKGVDIATLSESIGSSGGDGGGAVSSSSNMIKIVIDANFKYYLSEAEYNSCNTIIIDENNQSFQDGQYFQLIFPYKYNKASAKIITVIRYHGVRLMKDSGYTAGTQYIINPTNSIRINIASENADGTITEMNDLAYARESLSFELGYNDAGERINATALLLQPLRKINLGLNDGSELDNTFVKLNLGVPFSDILDTDALTTVLQLHKSPFLVKIAHNEVNLYLNPFFRSLPQEVFPNLITLRIIMKNDGYSIDTGFKKGVESLFPYLMFDSVNGIYTNALGGHFPRIKQQLNSGYMIYPYYPDSKGVYTASTYVTTSGSLDNTNNNIKNVLSSDITSNNIIEPYEGLRTYTAGESYETAGRWVATQGYVYL